MRTLLLRIEQGEFNLCIYPGTTEEQEQSSQVLYSHAVAFSIEDEIKRELQAADRVVPGISAAGIKPVEVDLQVLCVGTAFIINDAGLPIPSFDQVQPTLELE